MRRVRYAPKARSDLIAIWDFTCERWSVLQAEKYLLALDQDVRALTETPMLGQSMDYIRQGYRRWPSGSHIIYFKQEADGIRVMRILHARMDVERELAEE